MSEPKDLADKLRDSENLIYDLLHAATGNPITAEEVRAVGILTVLLNQVRSAIRNVVGLIELLIEED